MTPVGLVAWLASAVFVLLLSVLIARSLRTGRAAIDAAALLFIVTFAITLHMLIMGLSGLLRPLPILISSTIGIAFLAAGLRRSGGISDLRQAPAIAVGLTRAWWRDLPRWVRWLVGTGVALSALRFAFLIWALPPFVWDSLSYHLTNVAHWIRVGRVETFEVPVTRIFNPANYEVLASWFTVFLHHDALVEAAGLPAYALAMLAVYAAARGMQRSRAASALAALAYASTPAVILAATGTKNDIHMAAYYLVAVALTIDLSINQPSEDGSRSLNRFVLLALVVMLAIGTKTYIAHLLPGLVFVPLVTGLNLLGWSNLIGHLRSAADSLRSAAVARRLSVLTLCLCGVLLAGYWNVRNWLTTDNPFYPYEVLIGGRAIFSGPESEFRLDVRELAANLESLADKFGDWRDPIRPDLPNTTGWGWFVYVVGLPAAGWAVLRRSRARPLVLAFMVSFLVVMLSNGPSPWNMRFVIWFPAVFALCFAELADSLPRRLPRFVQSGLGAYLVGLLALNFVGTLNYNRVSADEFRDMLALPTSERDAARFRDNMPEPYLHANQIVPAEAVLGFNTTGNGFVYPLYRADYSQEIVYVPFDASDNCQHIADQMMAGRTRYLLVAPEHTDDQNIALLRRCAESGEVLRERARGLYVLR